MIPCCCCTTHPRVAGQGENKGIEDRNKKDKSKERYEDSTKLSRASHEFMFHVAMVTF
jgi:hypothetical protein